MESKRVEDSEGYGKDLRKDRMNSPSCSMKVLVRRSVVEHAMRDGDRMRVGVGVVNR